MSLENSQLQVSNDNASHHCERYLALTNHRLKDILHAFDKLLINMDNQIIQNLPVVSQVKVQQTMFVLLRSVVFCVDLRIQTLKVKR